MILWNQKTLHPRKCEMKISPAVLINKKCHWPPNVHEGSQNWDPADATAPHGDCWGARWVQEARGTKKQDWPQIAEVQMKGMNSVSPGLHLLTHRRLNTWTWYLIFDLQRACSLCCKLVCRLTSPPASLEQFSQSYWDADSWAQNPKHSHQIK